MTQNSFNHVIITRPDGQKLCINKGQIIYVTRDIVDDSGRKTEIVTTAGSFIILKPFDEVMAVLLGEKKGEL